MLTEPEKKIINKLLDDYKRTGKLNCLRGADIFKDLSIAEGISLAGLHESDYVSIGGDGTHECLKLTQRGIDYMEDLISKTDGMMFGS